jgi:uncharacterized protein
VEWLWLGLVALLLLLLIAALTWHIVIFRMYMPYLVRGFQETPLFNIPFGPPQPDAEGVLFPTTHNLMLHGCYLQARTSRRGVILFGLEFGSKRWSCAPYCDYLRDAGYDVFAFESRGQGESPSQPGYVPMVWVTDFELDDYRAAIAYLKSRPDADPQGIGFFGLSKGGSAGLHVACENPYVRCCVTDGIFALHATMIPYMRKYIFVYTRKPWMAKSLPQWYYQHAARLGRKLLGKERHCTFPNLEKMLPRLTPRPLLMIHGDSDTYVKPDLAEELFALAREPKELWVVEDARHNQAFHVANGEYKERVLTFFDKHLAVAPQILACGQRADERLPAGIGPPVSVLLQPTAAAVDKFS